MTQGRPGVAVTAPAPAADRWPARVPWRAVVAVVVPVLVVAAVTFASAALGLVRLDLVTFSGFAAQLEQSLPAGAALPAGTALPPVGLLVVAQLVAVPVGALGNSVPALGEEVGWRGWLVPALLPLGTWPALLVALAGRRGPGEPPA